MNNLNKVEFWVSGFWFLSLRKYRGECSIEIVLKFTKEIPLQKKLNFKRIKEEKWNWGKKKI